MFFHRRKFLRSVLLSAFKNRLSKPDADAIMQRQGLGPQTRAETLDVEAMLALCEAVREQLE
jgi:16S rRNA (adenine1518-N6/adenine1519-N6)-dimethyltransferase